ncbi:translation initiation factor IF-3 [Candidatus Uhrbacteria bacterium]|nr:translation initiation factor IF-3 [Candidatus Uhrbacteria bacterium]
MRKNYRKSRADDLPKRDYRLNEAISASEVRLIDENGEHKGVVSLQEALLLAHATELDLVEIEPTAKPPVCKIIDFGRLRYAQEKELKKQRARQKKVEVKGIRLSLRIGDHDRGIRVAQSVKFLEQNDKVRLEVVLRGRERQRGDMARELIQNFIKDLESKGLALLIESPITMQGGKMSAVLGLKK